MLFFDIQFRSHRFCWWLPDFDHHRLNGGWVDQGTISLRSQDGWMFIQYPGTVTLFVDRVNFPIQQLPAFLQPVSTFLPMSRGIQAARMVVNGAGWSNVAGLLGGEVLVGLAYILIGYTLFRIVERASMSTGSLDSF